ncbi:mutS protein homolog 4-like isoform X2 [Dermacentor albipictus]|uniref:mutS protein homolog 4-like isoform X2 n=1 Tax=Dermacentor albipictus TaxID=60249 RepID=UPI0031FCD7A0
MSANVTAAPKGPSNTKTTNRTTSSSSLNLNAIFNTSSSGNSSAALVTPAPPKKLLRHGHATNSSSGARRRPTPGTASTDPLSKSVVVALVEGRGLARGEIGMASFDIRNPELVLAQFPDNRMYTNTLMKLQVLDPHEILLPKTLFEANSMPQLMSQLKQEMPSTTVTSLARKLFNENLGIQYVRQLCVPEYSSVETEVVNKYYALSATAALIHYVEVMQNVACTAHSIKVIFSTGEGVARIDSTTMHDLELLTNTVDPRSSMSLFGVLNHAKTPGGSRLMRVNMLQPPRDLDTIVQRQKAVQQIIDSEEFFYNFQFLLAKFADMESLLAALVQVPRVETLRTMEAAVHNCVCIKHILEHVEPLRIVLDKCEDTLLGTYASYITDVRYGQMHESICAVIREDVVYQKGIWNRVLQLCFSIKPDVNGLLDIARRTYSEVQDDIHEMVEKDMALECALPLRVAYSQLRGFYIQMNYTGSIPELPDKFIKVSVTKTTISFTTDSLIKMNDRAREAMHEIARLSSSVLTSVLHNVVSDIGCLYKLAEVVSNVDFLLSLAEACTLSDYVRPEFTDTLCIVEGRHPVLEKLGMRTFIPNDSFASSHHNCNVITGPNMSGKSTYLKQVAALQVMAQLGSFVPAKYASFRIADQIFARTGHRDDIETNCSTFLMEMREINYILQNFTDTSLIIIDELGRGTSEEEGSAMCIAITEKLINSDAFVIIATHFDMMTQLESMYPNVINYHMEVETETEAEGDDSPDAGATRLRYIHRLARGTCSEPNYGLKLAEISHTPSDVLARAYEVSNLISASLSEDDNSPLFEDDVERKLRRAEIELAGTLGVLALHSKMEGEELRLRLLEEQRKARALTDFRRSLTEMNQE